MTSSELATTNHACDACGGTGRSNPCGCNSDGRGEGLTRAHHHRCPVCLGAGRISDRMPVADALADAETLRLYVSLRAKLETARETYGRQPEDIGREFDLSTAIKSGAWAGYYLSQSNYDAAVELARDAARAAFRACPGLRG